MIQMVLFNSGWEVVAIAPEEAEECNLVLLPIDSFYALPEFRRTRVIAHDVHGLRSRDKYRKVTDEYLCPTG